jgi:Lon protease-like protein
MTDGRILPMFPLGTVLFPYGLLPLHVFEPRYRVMIRHVMDGDHEFGVVLIERGSEVGGGDVRFDTGTIARVVQAAELPDGGYALATVGMSRVRVTRWLPDDPYPHAEVVALADETAHNVADREARDRAVAALAAVTTLVQRLDPRFDEAPMLAGDPVRASYEAAALAPIGPLDAQRVLEAANAATRLELLTALLGELADELRARLDLDDPGE